MDRGFRNVVVTGAKGFLGRHLVDALNHRPHVAAHGFDVDSPMASLAEALRHADAVFHLAGVNRPERVEEYEEGNHLLTRKLCAILEESGRTPLVIFSSSVQAELANPYGRSKLMAEGALRDWAERTDAGVVIFRLKSVFGKWCRPDYNSVVATFCHNAARGLPLEISDPAKKIGLVYIDEVVAAFVDCLDRPPRGVECRDVAPSFSITLGDLAGHIEMFRDGRASALLPDLADAFSKRLHATYVSYLKDEDLSYPLLVRPDARGEVAEFLKQAHCGQVFISRTRPGVTRGDHFHHSKVEKFLVVEGEAAIRLRRLDQEEVIEYRLSGQDFRVVDIPPGYAHSIENTGPGELITLFWASELFDPEASDTHPLRVLRGEKQGTGT